MPRDWNPFYLGPDEEYIRAGRLVPFAVLALIGCLFVLRRRGKSAGYLVSFALFYGYLWAFVCFTLFPFPIQRNPDPIHFLFHAYVAWIPGPIRGDFDIHSEQV